MSDSRAGGKRLLREVPGGASVLPPAAVALRGLHKTYGQNVQALRGIDLEIEAGEFLTLLGPSGSGKTTLLMVVAGFERPTRGSVAAGGINITTAPPEKRNFGVVFQNYALFPHLSVFKNVAYPLGARGIRGRKRQEAVHSALQLVGLEAFSSRRPSQLSGGQQQRVALARALVYQPEILLLDEPLGALDRALRERMQTELRNLHRKVGVTFLYVTHDQEEALTMSDRIVVMHDGLIEQIGLPEEIYMRPRTRFVANFLGAANLLDATVLSFADGLATVRLSAGFIARARCNAVVAKDTSVSVMIRPERVRLTPSTDGRSAPESLSGTLESVVFGGNRWRYEVRMDAAVVNAHTTDRANVDPGDRVNVAWNEDDVWLVLDEEPLSI